MPPIFFDFWDKVARVLTASSNDRERRDAFVLFFLTDQARREMVIF